MVDVAQHGVEWIHEITYAGYRTKLALAGKECRQLRALYR